jgi:hypothetical protein
VVAWEVSVSGPFDRWPARTGFDKFYGYIDGEQFSLNPQLIDGTTCLPIPRDPKYHFNTDMTDNAIAWVQATRSLTPDRPFLMCYASSGGHPPHTPPKAWFERGLYKGEFNQGWDQLREEILARQKQMGIVPATTKLADNPEYIKKWATLSADEQKVFSRQMEVYATLVESVDHEVGRLVDAIDALGVPDNTIIVYIAGDNGGSSIGEINGTFMEWSPLNDAPRVVNGVEQIPMAGTSMLYLFNDGSAKEGHTTQYDEVVGNRSIYHDGWLAAVVHVEPWYQEPRVKDFAQDRWELYHMHEAKKNNVLPLDDRKFERLNPMAAGRPDLLFGRKTLTLYPGMTSMTENGFINTKAVSYTIDADLEIPQGGAEGVLLSQAGPGAVGASTSRTVNRSTPTTGWLASCIPWKAGSGCLRAGSRCASSSRMTAADCTRAPTARSTSTAGRWARGASRTPWAPSTPWPERARTSGWTSSPRRQMSTIHGTTRSPARLKR